ncbi:MAG: DUF6106 family protein [Oscillospiraceae bacterium]|jgi:hypothetical protein|nr:DUF6106 family protein [Oscillospiraceae bacterium]
MITDIICEQLVAKKIEPKDIVKAFVVFMLIMSVTLGVSVLVDMLLSVYFGGVWLLSLIGGCYLAYRYMKTLSIEYEYIFVNGEMTVDKIIAKSSRKRLFSFDTRTIEKMGKYDPNAFANKQYDSRLNFSETYAGEGAYFAEIRDKKHGSVLLIFSPNEKIISALKPYMNKLVYREAFPNI